LFHRGPCGIAAWRSRLGARFMFVLDWRLVAVGYSSAREGIGTMRITLLLVCATGTLLVLPATVCAGGHSEELTKHSTSQTDRSQTAKTGPLVPCKRTELGSAAFKHSASLTAVTFAPDGRRVATAGRDHAVCVWDWPSGNLVQRTY
jgi:hypothetical protein